MDLPNDAPALTPDAPSTVDGPPDAAGGIGLTIDPAMYTFAATAIGMESQVQVFHLHNEDQRPAEQLTVALEGGDQGAFVIVSSTCAGSLAPASTCDVSVVFRPSTPGMKQASLTARASLGRSASSDLFSVSTSARTVEVQPAGRYFGSIFLGATKELPLVVANAGVTAIGPLVIQLGAEPAFVLAQDQCTGVSLAAGATCALRVRFQPASHGEKSGVIIASAPGVRTAASLDGTAIKPATLTATPASLDFDLNAIGGGLLLSVIVGNDGDLSVPAPSVLLEGPDAAAFSLMLNSGCSGPLNSSDSCGILVKFQPRRVGPHSADIRVTAGTLVTTVPLAGIGVQRLDNATLTLGLSPGDTFGSVKVGDVTTATLLFTNHSNVSVGPLMIDVVGTNASEFTVTSTDCPPSVAPNAACRLTVRFAPAGTDTRTARVRVIAPPAGWAAEGVSGVGLP